MNTTNTMETVSPNVTNIIPFNSSDLYPNVFGFSGFVENVKVYNEGKIFVMDTDIVHNCDDIILELFEKHNKSNDIYPVSVTGLKTDEKPGSHRFCTWNKRLAEMIDVFVKDVSILERYEKYYVYESISKYFRFMIYENGGEHFPHYDSDFHIADKLSTKYSLVMYFTDNETGELAFVNDKRDQNSVDRRTDWDRQANEDEIYLKIKPKKGRIVFFPHNLCHTVLPFTETGDRIIARGDVIFKSTF